MKGATTVMQPKKANSYTVKVKNKLSKKDLEKRKKARKPQYSAYMYTVAEQVRDGTMYSTFVMICDGKYPLMEDILEITRTIGPIVCIQRISLEGMEEEIKDQEAIRRGDIIYPGLDSYHDDDEDFDPFS